MATSEAKEIKKQETLVRFSIISYKTRLRVYVAHFVIKTFYKFDQENDLPVAKIQYSLIFMILVILIVKSPNRL